MRAVALASMMAVVSGLVCVLIGVLRLGFVTELLSKPIRYGYMNGIALTVLISQLPKLFGFSIDGVGPLRDLLRITEGILGGQANWTSFAVGVGTLAAILLLKPYKRIPGLLQKNCRERVRKSTRLNSSHMSISYAVFCLKKKKRAVLQKHS